jgi:hypothetical protein
MPLIAGTVMPTALRKFRRVIAELCIHNSTAKGILWVQPHDTQSAHSNAIEFNPAKIFMKTVVIFFVSYQIMHKVCFYCMRYHHSFHPELQQ